MHVFIVFFYFFFGLKLGFYPISHRVKFVIFVYHL